MFSLSGTLTRKQYWYRQLFFMAEVIIVMVLGIMFLDAINTESPNASTTTEFIATGVFFLLLANMLTIAVASIFVVIARARDIGNTVMWSVIAILVPFGWVVLGLIPSSSQTGTGINK